MNAIGFVGVLLGLAIMIYLVCFQNWNVLLSTIVASLFVALLNGLNLWTAISDSYLSGAAGWVKSMLIMFTLGAVFGRVIQRTGTAQSLGKAIAKVIGKNNVGLCIHLLSAILVLGGVDPIIAVLTITPISMQMIKEANLPRRYGFACMIGGASSYAMSMPGSPIIHNLMPTFFLGTTTTAAWKLGLAIFAINIALEFAYMHYLRLKFNKAGRGFDLPEDKMDEFGLVSDDRTKTESALPSAASGVVCLLIVILSSIILGGVVGLESLAVVCTALVVACIVNLIWNRKYLRQPVSQVLEEGSIDGIVGCILCAAVLGFVGVVQTTTSYTAFANWTNGLGTSLSYLGIFLSIQLMAATTGNSPGTLNIFLQNFAQGYVSMGINPQVVHRLASASCMGFDCMPHNPGTITYLRTYRLSYREAYIDVFMTLCLCPAVAAFCGALIAFTGLC